MTEITFTELTNKAGVIAKKYSVDNAGNTVTTPAANVFSATAKTMLLKSTEISNYFDSMAEENSKAVVLGIWHDADDWKEFDIVTASDDKLDPASGIISRSSEYFQYANNDSVSLMMLDFDSVSEDRDLFFGELEVALGDAIIGSDKLMHWKRPSTSASVSLNGKTGNGLHIFIPVKNADQKLIELAHRLCWLQDYGGGYKITKSGNILPESLIDSAVKGPERIVYSSNAVVESGEFEAVKRTCEYFSGGVVDCELAISILEDLAVDFKTAWNSKKRSIEGSEEVLAVKEAWKADQIEIKIATGMPVKQAKQESEALSNQELLSSDFLYETDGTPIQVVEILKDPDSWNGVKGFCDPVKKNFGRNTAMLMKKGGRLVLKSFNHGGVYYWLKWTAEDLDLHVESMEDDDLADTAAELIINSNMTGIKRKALMKKVAKRLGVGVVDIESDIKDNKLGEFEKKIAEIDSDTEEKKWISCGDNDTHFDIISNYLYNQNSCRGFAGVLYTWGKTIWSKQSIPFIKTVVGEKYGNVKSCKKSSDYSALAKEIVTWDTVTVDEWVQTIGFPCVDGMWVVSDTSVTKTEYKKEMNCRYKIKCAPDFNYEGNMPWFQRVLDNVDSPELFQQICGLASCGKLADMQMAAVFQGTGGSGKGTISRVLSSLFPRNRVTSVGFNRMNDEKYVIDLADSVLNVMPETDKAGKKLTMTGFRAITGGDYVTGWRLYGGPQTFRPSCSHIISLNQWPATDGAGQELFRRVGKTIVRFDANNTEQIVGLDQKIIDNELSFILGWLIDGVEMYLTAGLAPGNSLSHYDSWVGSYDVVELFITENLVKELRGRIPRAEIWKKFCVFCEESNHLDMRKGEFFAKIREHKYYNGESITKGAATLKGFEWNNRV